MFPAKKKKERKPVNKKALVISLSVIAAVLVLVTVGLCLWFFVFKKDDVYVRGYVSVDSFEKATLAQVLPSGVSVSEYDVVNDVFITQSSYQESATLKTVVLYGLAGKDRVYVDTFYTSVVSVKGDYAIVTMPTNSGYSSGKFQIGLIKYRGEGTENGVINVSGFSIEYNSSNTEQFYFCGDYLCIMGDKDAPSSQAKFTTFYDYKSKNKLLPCFQARYGYDSDTGTNYTFLQCDDYIVAYNAVGAYFFDVKRDVIQGYLELFNDSSSFVSPYASTDKTANMHVVYMGNGWFARYAAQTSTSVFSGYKFCYQSIDVSGSDTLVFARSTTDFYNVKTGKTKKIPQIYGIVDVANKYTRADFAATCNGYNNAASAPDDYPCLNPADMIADGYSLLYYFYQPYIGQEGLSDVEQSVAKETYCILDENVNVILPETLFPIVTIDGIGFETCDPYFDINFGDAVIYTEKGKKTLFYADAGTQYAVVGAKGDCVTIAALDIAVARDESSEELGVTYGAATKDGKIIVDCVYDRVSPFYGDYAVATEYNGKDYIYYRLDKLGQKEILEDVYMIKDGVYIYLEGEKCGLKTFAGDVLLAANYDNIALTDNYMLSGVYQVSYVLATAGDVTSIYILE